MTNLAKSAKSTIIPVLRYRDLLSTMDHCLRSRHYVYVVIAGKHPAPLPILKIRVVNVVNLMKLQPDTEHPHGLSDPIFDEIFTEDKPIIFAFHGYPWLIHRLTYRRTNHDNIHVRGYKEEGTITTAFDMTVLNELDRFHLVMDAIHRLPQTGDDGVQLKRVLMRKLSEHIEKHGEDLPEIRNWKWQSTQTSISGIDHHTYPPH